MTIQPKSVIKSYFETEIWKDIPNHAPYQASNLGNIRNGSGKVLKPVRIGHKRSNYVGVYVGGGKKGLKQFVHKLVLLAFCGEAKEGQIACHKDDNGSNNKLDNLYWGSHKSNAQDAIKNGKFAFANPLNTTIYNLELVKEIRAKYTGKRGEQSALAREYGMSVSNVHLIVHNKARVA